ncbi:MAG: hypothetical protein QG553_884 [Patescibacteria group bacterium]|nr:hypothetical protein [Patescibacteria group bacterium]
MITYRIDKQPNTTVTTQIRDMNKVLSEVPATLRFLLELLAQNEAAISTPSINSYRYELQKLVEATIENANMIIEQSQRLSSVSEQAGKHLSAIEEHFGQALREEVQANRQTSRVA